MFNRNPLVPELIVTASARQPGVLGRTARFRHCPSAQKKALPTSTCTARKSCSNNTTMPASAQRHRYSHPAGRGINLANDVPAVAPILANAWRNSAGHCSAMLKMPGTEPVT